MLAQRKWRYIDDIIKKLGVNIMLLGNTGAGKSASGNTIMGEDRFLEHFSPQAVTYFSELANTVVDGQRITVMDTVGLSNTQVKISEAKRQIENMLKEKDVHVFLLVVRLGDKFTEFESKLLKWIRQNFGADIFKRTIVLFTHVDQLHEPVERYLHESKSLQSIIHQCFGRYHVFNNRDKGRAQVNELLEKIKKVRMMNGELSRYSIRDYRKVQHDLLMKDCAIGAAVCGVMFFMIAPALGVGKAAQTGAMIGTGLLALAAFLGVIILARKCFS
ncbi:GTPase IMAP family member 8-like [Danio aesculapii]|uniref:GTPase IMAP family member 8-like n=1 Tax=Danio aesculapii TaxID=1142201 RepID=UPI0024BF37ED|nr:GTPase IMAP family member 8-like [Danio aesculapii]